MIEGHRARAVRGLAGVVLVVAMASAAAQEVHKCTVNGQAVYQAGPCSGKDAVVDTGPVPSDAERRAGQADAARQRMEAATGRIYVPRPLLAPPPRYVPPTPRPLIVAPPPPSRTVIMSSTTVNVFQGTQGANSVTRVTTHRTTVVNDGARSYPPATLPPPRDNCERLNRDLDEALDRRDAMKAPGELRNRQEMLDKAIADADRVRALAHASNCRLAR